MRFQNVIPNLILCSSIPFVLFLSGCTGTLEDITTQTRDQVRSSEDEIRKTSRGAQIQGAIEMLDSDSPAIVARGLQRLMKDLEEKSIGSYIGTALPVSHASVSVTVAGNKTEFPNVMLVDSTKSGLRSFVLGPDLDLASREMEEAPVSYEQGSIFITAILKTVKLWDLQSVSSDFLPSEKLDYQTQAMTMVRVVTAILGGAYVQDLYEVAIKKLVTRRMLVKQSQRQTAADRMRDVINRLEDADHPMDAVRTEAQALFNSRVGVTY